MMEEAAAASAAAAATGGGGGVLHLLDRMGKQKHTKHTQSYKCVLHSLTVKPTANERKKKKKQATCFLKNTRRYKHTNYSFFRPPAQHIRVKKEKTKQK